MILSGFGKQILSESPSFQLSYVYQKVMRPKQCQKLFNESIDFKDKYHDNMLCTWPGQTPACSGDSGDPLVMISGNCVYILL